MIQSFLEAEKTGASIGNLHMSLDKISDICIAEYKKKYNVDMMDSIQLAEEIDELMVALAAIQSDAEKSPSWRLSAGWFNLLEELEDVDIMVHIVNRVLNSQLGTENELYDMDFDFRSNSIGFIRLLGVRNQSILKGVRKQFNSETAVEGRKLIQNCLGEIYSICIAIQYRFYIKTSDINRMRYVKVARLLNKYGYNV